MLDAMTDAAVPYIAEALGIIIVALMGWLTKRASTYLGVKTTVQLRHMLDEALSNGALQADTTNPDALAAAIVAYVRRTMPETIDKLGHTEGTLMARARAAAKGHLDFASGILRADPTGPL